MSDITIQEEYRLPSLGKIYSTPFDPDIKLRSMTVAEEMKKLSATTSPYKVMAEIIEGCLERPLPVSVYDMCLGDYQYLLHKLRVVTYGPEYDLSTYCYHCDKIFVTEVNLDELAVNYYDESLDQLKTFKLPVTGKTIEIGFQTPRDLDKIEQEEKELKKKFPDNKDDWKFMLNLESMIKSVDGRKLFPGEVREFIKTLPMKDALLIMQTAEKLNERVGVDIRITTNCPECGKEVNTTFRWTNEFFRPEIHI